MTARAGVSSRLWLLPVLLLLGCQTFPGDDARTDYAIRVFDGHADFAVHFARAEPAWSADAHDLIVGLPGQADIPRWRTGGVEGMLATVGSDLGPGPGPHFPRVLMALDWLDAIGARYSEDIAKVGSLDELRRAQEDGRIALMPAIEGGDQLDGSLDNLRTAYERGVRSVLIVYDHHNDLGDGAMVLEQSPSVAHAPHGGLSQLGRRMVAEMNRLGMLVDLSHADEQTAHQAMAASSAPVIFSHSGARALADTPRNLSDETLRRLGANGGIVMVPLVPYLTTTEHWRWWSAGEARYAELVEMHGEDQAAIGQGMEAWDHANPQPVVTIDDVADQIEYITEIAGDEHVGIGTDFDGMGPFVVKGLEDAGRLTALLDNLRKRGWTEARLRALASGNFERVLARVEAAADR